MMAEFDSCGHFGRVADTYEVSAFHQSSGLQALSEREIQIVLNALDRQDLRSVLDVGIGTGRIARALCQRSKTVTGVDVTPEMLAHSNRFCPTAQIAQAKLGDALPFREGAFDAVVCVRVLKYVADWDFAMSEIARVLRAHGRVVLEIANRRSVARWGYAALPVRLATFPEVRLLIARHGFRLAEVWRGSRAPFPIYRSISSDQNARRIESMERLLDRFLGQTALARSFIMILDAD